MNDNDDSSSSGNGNGNTAVAFIADAGTRIIPCVFADWNAHKSVSDTRSNVAASVVLSSGGNGIGNINGTSNINADDAVVVVDDDDDDDDDDDSDSDSDSDSDTNVDMPELEECRQINNQSRHIIGNRQMGATCVNMTQGTAAWFISCQFTISQGTDHGLMKKINLTHPKNQ